MQERRVFATPGEDAASRPRKDAFKGCPLKEMIVSVPSELTQASDLPNGGGRAYTPPGNMGKMRKIPPTDVFCMKPFFATEAAMLCAFNLPVWYQQGYPQSARITPPTPSHVCPLCAGGRPCLS